jgi:hypothetical protein
MVTAAPLLEDPSHPVFGPDSRSEKYNLGEPAPRAAPIPVIKTMTKRVLIHMSPLLIFPSTPLRFNSY